MSISYCGISQNKVSTDSLETLQAKKNLSIPEQISVLRQLSRNSPDTEKALYYSKELLKIARSVDSVKAEFEALRLLGLNSPDTDKALYYSVYL